MKEILILGLGNEMLHDDGIGIKILRDLKTLLKSNYIDFLELVTGSLDMLEMISGYHILFIIDSIRTKDGIPGNVYKFSMNNYKPTVHLDQFHDVRFADSIHLAKKIGMKVPEKIIIFGVEVSEDTEFTKELSRDLKNNYDDILIQIVKEIVLAEKTCN